MFTSKLLLLWHRKHKNTVVMLSIHTDQVKKSIKVNRDFLLNSDEVGDQIKRYRRSLGQRLSKSEWRSRNTVLPNNGQPKPQSTDIRTKYRNGLRLRCTRLQTMPCKVNPFWGGRPRKIPFTVLSGQMHGGLCKYGVITDAECQRDKSREVEIISGGPNDRFAGVFLFNGLPGYLRGTLTGIKINHRWI